MQRDRERDMLIDPAKVHGINYRGEYFNVPGPHMCEPSLQRTPVLYQAGQSGRGVAFAARHAEGIFAIHPNTDACRAAVRELSAALALEGRSRDDIKYFPGVTVIVAPTDAGSRTQARDLSSIPQPGRRAGLVLRLDWGRHLQARLGAVIA